MYYSGFQVDMISVHRLWVHLLKREVKTDKVKSRHVNHNELENKMANNFILSVQAFKIVLCTARGGLNHIV